MCYHSMSNQITLLNNYYLQYYIIGIVNERIRLILIDTGAAMSFIKQSFVHQESLTPIQPYTVKGYLDHHTIGDKYLVEHSTNINVILSNTFNKTLLLKTTQTKADVLGAEVLFGMDFLDSFESYSITKEQLILREGAITHYIPRITVDTETIRETLNY
uniref:Uncharacterized protein n=1 Tax=Blueberry red ringspot virus TaxID=172220 RepID=A0A6H1NPX1_9VIRU|nr:hypothetical protein [Blueberry red ringspot virus]QIZ03253.1 hypothetical protein [Blueberry red ringspot virus]QIZ03261.1 hypothetical protein [Blueberry red ringspot virus]QIZ03269.1 hypothetical protein [Blueberry red ringspot virus]QIZ03277.1 hypothetical protein [Blueberry red ringspot virus]